MQEDKCIANPGFPPFYSAYFFETIKKVYDVSPQKVTEAQWYHLLIEENVTKEIDEEQGKRFSLCGVVISNVNNAQWATRGGIGRLESHYLEF